MSSDDQTLVFVYGTLKRGHALNSWMTGCEFVSEGYVAGYRMASMGAYPALFYTNGEGQHVQGELWRMPDDLFASLETMEHDVGYSTKEDVVYVGHDGPDVVAKIFLYDDWSGEWTQSWEHTDNTTTVINKENE